LCAFVFAGVTLSAGCMPRFEVVWVAGQTYIPLKKYEASPGLSYGQAMACSALFFPR